jgi:predicted RNA polymerase sigma factor
MGTTEALALRALMLLQSSRLPARTDGQGNLRSLAEQERVRWDGRLIDDDHRAGRTWWSQEVASD